MQSLVRRMACTLVREVYALRAVVPAVTAERTDVRLALLEACARSIRLVSQPGCRHFHPVHAPESSRA